MTAPHLLFKNLSKSAKLQPSSTKFIYKIIGGFLEQCEGSFHYTVLDELIINIENPGVKRRRAAKLLARQKTN